MKWFFVFVLMLNLIAGVYGILEKRRPVDIRLREVNPAMLKVLPWVGSSASGNVAHLPIAELTPVEMSSEAAKHHVTSSVPALSSSVPANLVCFEWRSLDEPLLARIKNELPTLHLIPDQWSESAQAVGRGNGQFWVYYPASTRVEAMALTQQLKRKGFDSYFVHNESKGSGALSLGVFVYEKTAKALAARIRAAGFGKVAVMLRGKRSTVTTLAFKRLNRAQADLLVAMQRRLAPDIAIQPISRCP